MRSLDKPIFEGAWLPIGWVKRACACLTGLWRRLAPLGWLGKAVVWQTDLWRRTAPLDWLGKACVRPIILEGLKVVASLLWDWPWMRAFGIQSFEGGIWKTTKPGLYVGEICWTCLSVGDSHECVHSASNLGGKYKRMFLWTKVKRLLCHSVRFLESSKFRVWKS